MRPEELLACLRTEPFWTIRIQVARGRTYEVHHPDMVRVSGTSVVILKSVSDDLDVFARFYTDLPPLIERLDHFEPGSSAAA